VSGLHVDAHRLRRNWWLPGITGLLAILGVLFMMAPSPREPLLPVLGGFMTWIGAWLVPISLLRNSFPLLQKTTLRATPEALEVNDEEPIPVEEIMEARTVPLAVRNGETVIELVTKRGKYRFSLTPKAAEDILATLGTEAGARRATFTLVAPFRKRFGWSVGLLGLPWFLYILFATSSPELFPLLFTFIFVILPVCALAAVVAGILRGKVTVGAEGFTTSWLGRKKLHRFAEVRRVERESRPMAESGKVVDTIAFFPDKRIRLSAVDAPDTHAQRGAESRALADTMHQAFERYKRSPDIAELGTHLGRGARSAKEWLAGLDQLVRGGGTHYRVAAVTPEILTEVTKSNDGAADTRIGAAAALLRMGDKTHRSTVRIAAEACAEPKLRIALLELVEVADDEERFERALARVR
jgi:hypothetical protein